MQIKLRLEEYESKSGKINETVTKYTTELSEISEKLEDLKATFESKDSGMHDTSPLVRIKAALQNLKKEIANQDLRTGVISHSLLTARVTAANRKRMAMAKSAMKRNARKGGAGSSALAAADDSLIDDADY